MNDSQWSLLIGVIIVVVTRTVDIFLPKGYIAKIASRWLKKDDDTPED